MPERPVKDLAASVRARLTSLARQRGEDFQFVLTRYAVERLLYRLGRLAHADSFILKGAMLFAAWTNEPHRPTRDVDLLGFGDGSAGRILSVLEDLCTMAVDVPDGLRFDAASITLVEAAHQEYQGQCVKLKCHLGDAAIPLSIDIGFGDAVVPPAREIAYPVLLDMPAPRVRTYPPETVVAEKVQAMVALGLANSRMKDLFDVSEMSRRFAFEGRVLAESLGATLRRRATPIPLNPPVVFTAAYSQNAEKRTQWNAFVRRGRLEDRNAGLECVIQQLAGFVWPVLASLAQGEAFEADWQPGGPWKEICPGQDSEPRQSPR